MNAIRQRYGVPAEDQHQFFESHPYQLTSRHQDAALILHNRLHGTMPLANHRSGFPNPWSYIDRQIWRSAATHPRLEES
jgi:hypothetical protein